MKKIELLAPAGDLERLKIAVLYGADAVYLGGKQFSLRSRASNFGLKEIAEGVAFAKEHGAHVHVTVNMLPHEEDLHGLKEYLMELERIGVTAIIAASPGIMMCAKNGHRSWRFMLAPSIPPPIPAPQITGRRKAWIVSFSAVRLRWRKSKQVLLIRRYLWRSSSMAVCVSPIQDAVYSATI